MIYSAKWNGFEATCNWDQPAIQNIPQENSYDPRTRQHKSEIGDMEHK